MTPFESATNDNNQETPTSRAGKRLEACCKEQTVLSLVFFGKDAKFLAGVQFSSGARSLCCCTRRCFSLATIIYCLVSMAVLENLRVSVHEPLNESSESHR